MAEKEREMRGNSGSFNWTDRLNLYIYFQGVFTGYFVCWYWRLKGLICPVLCHKKIIPKNAKQKRRIAIMFCLLNRIISFFCGVFITVTGGVECFWLLLLEIQVALTGVPRARCQDTRTAKHTVTLSLISVTPCHRSMPRSHATATHSRGSTGSCGTGQSGGRKRRRSAYWNAWRERRKAARPATGGVRGVLETCAPPTPLVQTLQQTLTHSARTTKSGSRILIFTILNGKRASQLLLQSSVFWLACPH